MPAALRQQLMLKPRALTSTVSVEVVSEAALLLLTLSLRLSTSTVVLEVSEEVAAGLLLEPVLRPSMWIHKVLFQ